MSSDAMNFDGINLDVKNLDARHIERLAAEVIATARSCGARLVTAESCTAGAIANALSRAPGAGDHLDGGFVTYTKEMKTRVLGVDPQLLAQKTAVCAEVAQAMALGALRRSPATVAVAVTGVAGPKPDEDGNPVGLMFFCAARKGGAPLCARRDFKGLSRDVAIAAAICESLRLLKRSCG
jgi:nicotinamide-nucleotide amidase